MKGLAIRDRGVDIDGDITALLVAQEKGVGEGIIFGELAHLSGNCMYCNEQRFLTKYICVALKESCILPDY